MGGGGFGGLPPLCDGWPTAFDCTMHLIGKPVQEETVATQSHWLGPSRVRGLALATGVGVWPRAGGLGPVPYGCFAMRGSH